MWSLGGLWVLTVKCVLNLALAPRIYCCWSEPPSSPRDAVATTSCLAPFPPRVPHLYTHRLLSTQPPEWSFKTLVRSRDLSSQNPPLVPCYFGIFWGHCCLRYLLTPRGDLFAQGFAWHTHSFIQESTQMSSPKRGLPWPHNLKRRFLPIPSNLLFSFSLLCNILNLSNECLPSLEWEGPGYRACSST